MICGGDDPEDRLKYNIEKKSKWNQWESVGGIADLQVGSNDPKGVFS